MLVCGLERDSVSVADLVLGCCDDAQSFMRWTRFEESFHILLYGAGDGRDAHAFDEWGELDES